MVRGQKQYTDEFKKTIVELYNSGKILSELSSKYAGEKSTITTCIKQNQTITLDKNTTITAAEYKKLLNKNGSLKRK